MNNGIVSAVRKTKNDFQLDYEVDPVTIGGEIKNPLDTIVDSENLSSVLSLCENVLSDVEKSVVYSQMSGLSYTETAEKLGLTPKAVDNALQRARKKLKNVFN
jgi:RNA polymerase sporulation-specific sigma factor